LIGLAPLALSERSCLVLPTTSLRSLCGLELK